MRGELEQTGQFKEETDAHDISRAEVGGVRVPGVPNPLKSEHFVGFTPYPQHPPPSSAHTG